MILYVQIIPEFGVYNVPCLLNAYYLISDYCMCKNYLKTR